MTRIPGGARTLLGLMLLPAAFGLDSSSAAELTIRPGAAIDQPAGCTLNFVFSEGASLYIGTAGHCTNGVGDRVSTPAAGPFGTVVYRRLAGWDDFALILIDPAKEALVDSSLEVFGRPTGSTERSETAAGDVIGLVGNGMVLGENPITRARRGILVADDAERYIADVPAIYGDSGAPVVHLASGKALGIVSGLAVTSPPGTVYGSTLERILAIALAGGFDLRLITA